MYCLFFVRYTQCEYLIPFVGCFGDFLFTFYVLDKNRNLGERLQICCIVPRDHLQIGCENQQIHKKRIIFPKGHKNVSKPLISLSLFVLRELISSFFHLIQPNCILM